MFPWVYWVHVLIEGLSGIKSETLIEFYPFLEQAGYHPFRSETSHIHSTHYSDNTVVFARESIIPIHHFFIMRRAAQLATPLTQVGHTTPFVRMGPANALVVPLRFRYHFPADHPRPNHPIGRSSRRPIQALCNRQHHNHNDARWRCISSHRG